MHVDTDRIDKTQLREQINEAYGLALSDLDFIPRGEDSYTYKARNDDGRSFFVRVEPVTRHSVPAAQAHALLHSLHHRYGLTEAVPPRANKAGTFVLRHEGNQIRFNVAVFPFIEGKTLFEKRPSRATLEEVGELIARVHQTSGQFAPSFLPQEIFTLPFEPSLRNALRDYGSNQRISTNRQLATGLLRTERTNILATLQRTARLQQWARQADLELVFTHGDPNLDNFILDRKGAVHLTDWGALGLGPAERDLFAFIDLENDLEKVAEQSGFEIVLRKYVQVRGKAVLHVELFAFYAYRWALQEIADYAGRLIFRYNTLYQESHAWNELKKNLPIPHRQIKRRLRKVTGVVRRVLDG